VFIDDLEGTDDARITQQTLIDTQERLGALLDLMPTGLIIHQHQGVLYANQQALHLFDQTEERMVGQHLLDYVDDNIRDLCSEKFMASFAQNSAVRFPEIKFTTRTSQNRYIQATAGRLPWEGTSVIQILLEDITEFKLQEAELRKLTFHDVLTGAYNRRYFIGHAERVIQKAKLENKPFSLLVFDVDWFKKVNDTHGHLAGDEALKTVISVWQKNTRNNEENNRENDGTLARIGGEEFAIILPNTELDVAKIIAERIRESLEGHIISFEDISFNITASFGLTSLQSVGHSLDDLIRRADIALYRAKENGRNRVEFE